MPRDEFRDKMTVLIVDDALENLAVLSALLKESYRIQTSTTGAKALELARQVPSPDLILLDVIMNDMNGFEVCRQLKASSVTADIPVIFLTAQSNIQDEEEGLALGAVDYIHKPVSPPWCSRVSKPICR